MDYEEISRALHKKHQGKIETGIKIKIETMQDLATVYSPGVAGPSRAIAEDKDAVYLYTMKANTIAVVTDGTAVLGLGDIGPEAALPVMEGKAALFKKFANINAVPLCLDTQDVDEIVETVTRIAPVFGGINLEDISAPRCFEIEERLQDLGIPVFHDDQHGTAIVVLAGLINAARVADKKIEDLKVVINGAGAAGVAIANMLSCVREEQGLCVPVADIIVCDSKGMLGPDRENLSDSKRELMAATNKEQKTGTLADALVAADVFIGVSVGEILTGEMVRTMAPDPIIFALANPTPEIMPDIAREAGALVVATGRSDFPNQVNNVLAFPGIFKGALSVRAPRITKAMKIAAVEALAGAISEPSSDRILPNPLDPGIAETVAAAVEQAARK